MNALQYSFALDAGFDMQAVRDRVASRQHLLNGTPGLCWKAWLISEPLPGREQPKSYAPLYLFLDAASTLQFLAGGVYRGVTCAFGWTQPHQGPALADDVSDIRHAKTCSLRSTVLRTHDELVVALRAPESLPSEAIAQCRLVDVSRMAMRCYTFWRQPAAALALPDEDLCYEVVAMSMGLAG